jgi:hypothetical protein
MGNGTCFSKNKNNLIKVNNNIPDTEDETLKSSQIKDEQSSPKSQKNLFSNQCHIEPEPEYREIDTVVRNFDYSSNSNIFNYKNENPNMSLMKLVKHATFSKDLNYNCKFLEELNNARIDLCGFINRLLDFQENFQKIKEEIYERNGNCLIRTKEDFIKALDFFKKLQEEENENLNELIEIEKFKLPIPEDLEELKDYKYYEKFQKRFENKFCGKFELKNSKIIILHKDPEISFLLFITEDSKILSSLFNKNVKYVGIDFQDYSNETLLLSLVFAADC